MNTASYILPNWTLCYLVNDDHSGLSDEEKVKVDQFIEKGLAAYDRFWCLGPVDDLGFKHSNYLDNLHKQKFVILT